jgi:galactokinase/mevalonate kinase-like predicted kinase
MTYQISLLYAFLMICFYRALSLEDFLGSALGGGIMVASYSNLPAGSGMGGSSILAATILKSIGSLLKLDLSNDRLIYLVSEVEQLLTTGGGWQDQVIFKMIVD